MKRTLILAAAVAVAAGPLWFAAPAAKADGFGLFKRGGHGQSAPRSRKNVRPQVRGFLFQPGGYSYSVQDTYDLADTKLLPNDFGPHLDYAPSPYGIISNDPYH